MAKFRFYQDYETAFGQFTGAMSLHINNKKTEAVWTSDRGAEITFGGTGFKGNSDDILTAGQITSIKILDDEHDRALTVTDLDVKATKVMDKLEKGPEDLLFFLTRGDDRVIGNWRADVIFGGAGNDVLTGKGGNDIFYFRTYEESTAEAKTRKETDVITDFDTTGVDADFLYMDKTEEFTYTRANKGHDTLLTFEDGSSLLLEGVKRSEFREYLETSAVM